MLAQFDVMTTILLEFKNQKQLSMYLATDYSNKRFYFFDTDGEFIEDIRIDRNLFLHMTDWTSYLGIMIIYT